MRLWSLHPQFLDVKGLVAVWREGLLAQKVLLGNTKGYRNHPQLIRFQQHPNPVKAIAAYLEEVNDEAIRRGFNFNKMNIEKGRVRKKIFVTSGQIAFEFDHLKTKLITRDLIKFNRIKNIQKPIVHPLFKEISGPIEDWEKL